ncbi:MAG: hypothetical protein METHP_01139 [Methanoregula sp. SKADARSKE-2]|nr:MAG: hypothetical protein METHP_01139 [Methanoregula sp. SKADARSKE-2]
MLWLTCPQIFPCTSALEVSHCPPGSFFSPSCSVRIIPEWFLGIAKQRSDEDSLVPMGDELAEESTSRSRRSFPGMNC